MPYDHLSELITYIEQSRKSPPPKARVSTRKGTKTAYRQPAEARSRKSHAKTKASKTGVKKR